MSWLIDTLIVTGALIALVLVLRRPVARLFGPGMAYALWALPLLRLLLPPLVLPAQPASGDYVITSAPIAAAPGAAPLAEPGLTGSQLLLALWLAGAAAFLIWRAWGYAAMRHKLLAGALPVGTSGSVRLVETPATAAPVAFGVRDKVVALPLGFMASECISERDLAIAHELEHHAGRDLAVNIAMQPLLALHWFNPLAWAGWRALRRDQEAACDARVLAGRDSATRVAYARLIASFAQSPRLALAAPMACPVIGEKSIVHRLRSLTMQDPTPRRRQLGRALIGIGALALPLTASITYAADEVPPAPTAPPAAEAPKATIPEEVSPKREHRIVIIERQSGDRPTAINVDDSALKTRVITRDGKTIVFKTDKELSEPEIEAKLAEALARIPEMPEPPIPPVPPGTSASGLPHVVSRIMVLSQRQTGKPSVMVLNRRPDCEGETMHSSVSAAGSNETVQVMLCGTNDPKAHARLASDGLKRARDRIAQDRTLSDKVRDDVVRKLDAEIERLSKDG